MRGQRTRPSSLVGAWVGNGLVLESTAFESIATFVVDATPDLTITFSDIPSTYKHLQIRAIALSNSDSQPVLLRFNSDTTANYSQHYLAAQGSVSASGGTASTSSITLAGIYARGLNASNPWAFVIDVLDYKDTNKFKTVRAFHGADYNGSGEINLTSGNWRSSTAITTITLSMAASGFNQYSHFALYGIKG